MPNQCASRTSCLCIRLQSGKEHTVLQPCFSSVYNLVTAPWVTTFSIPNSRLLDTAHLIERGSTSCVPQSSNCINCVPRCLLHVYQWRPELSTPNMTSCVPRLVRNCISCIPRYLFMLEIKFLY